MSAKKRSHFENSFYEVAKELNLPGYDDADQNHPQLVKTFLDKPSTLPWLLVIDNADDMTMFENLESLAGEEDLFQYLPQSRQGRIIVTCESAKHAAVICESDCVEVPAMTELEAISMAQKRLHNVSPHDHSLQKLLHKLEYLPQGITQATSFIVYNSIEIEGYLNLLEANSEEVLAEPYADLRRDRQVPNSIIASAKLSFDQIMRESPNAIKIMSLITVVDNQAVPESLLDTAFEYTPFESAKALGILKALSLLVSRRDMKMYDMHKLVQISAQAWLKANESLIKWQETAESLLARCFPTAEYEIWDTCSAYLPHADVVLKYSNNDTPVRLKQRASILTKTATFLDQRGLYDRSESRHRESLAIREQFLGAEAEETVVVVQSLALTLRHVGKYDQAEKLCNRALDHRKRLLGDQHLATASVLSDLGIVLRHLGRWPEAGALHGQALQVREEILGRDDRLTNESVVALSAVLWHQSKNEEAERLNLRAIETSRKMLGKQHPQTLTTMNNMANTLWNKGLLEKAEALYKEVLLDREIVLGSDHPDTLITHSNIGALYWQMKRYEEAEVIHREVLRLRIEVLGQNHSDTITSTNNLAMAIRGQTAGKDKEEKLTEAASLLRDVVVPARTALLGKDSPDTLGAVNNLALTLRDLGQYPEAESLFRKTIAGLETVVGPKHRNTHTCYFNIATVLQHMERFDEAESYLRKCIDGRVQDLGPDHFLTQDARKRLADLTEAERELYRARIAAFND
jgi:tetratricopeptide (TPR) repeat protein